MIKIGIIASGSGSNAEAIMEACEEGGVKGKGKVVVLISNKKDAYCLKRAENHNIPAILIQSKDFKGTREDYDKLVVEALKKYDVQLVCLAGYMRLVSPYFLETFKDSVLNIHPALLPSFPGMHGYKDAIDYGVKISGCTVHFVDEKMDHGPIIVQKTLEVKFEDTEETLKERGLILEHEAFPEAVQLFCEDRLEIIGRKVKIKRKDK
ncbi:MAG: phosphoribosylglycinamide formyltransferase [Candidatus Lokiarchaeota archaeon]|nr:phosphoribosylglycinamide formyltransferase [Candidatus Lokiarchaeota archaeon]